MPQHRLTLACAYFRQHFRGYLPCMSFVSMVVPPLYREARYSIFVLTTRRMSLTSNPNGNSGSQFQEIREIEASNVHV